MAAAIPFAIQAGSAIYSHYKNKKANAATQANTAAQGAAAGQQFGAAGPLLQQGTGLAQQGQGTLGAAGSYYKNILGSRTAATHALAPEMSSALDFYKGGQGRIQNTMRGGARDVASAELERQKVGQLANMLPTARANAAQGATAVGGAQTGAGSALIGQGSNAAATGGYLSGGFQNANEAQIRRNTEAAEAWGRIASGIFGAVANRKKTAGQNRGGVYTGALPGNTDG